MKKKSTILLASCSLLTMGTIFVVSKPLAKTGAISDCKWNHYNAVDSSYFESGSKEYWVCCEHHEVVFEEPANGVINEGGTPSAEFVNNLAANDARYQTRKEADHVAAIKVNSIPTGTGSFAFASRNAYTNLTSVTFEAKWENATTTSWLSFGHSSNIANADNYTGMVNFSCENDGNWHSCTINYNNLTDPEYVFLQAAVGEFNSEATLLLKNIVINYNETSDVEPLEGTGKYFRSYYNSDWPELIAPSLSYETRASDGGNINRALVFEPNKLSTSGLNIVSRRAFKGVQEIKLKYKAIGGVKEGKGGWARFAFANDTSSCDIYSVFNYTNATFSPIYDGEWHEITMSTNADGYLFFGAAVGEFNDGTTFYFDEITIGEYWNNVKDVETFNHDCIKFLNADAVRNNVWTTVAI